MTLPAQDIVEQLRIDGEEKNDYCPWAVKNEAADTISRLTADNEALRKERDEAEADERAATIRAEKAESRATALEAEVGRLRLPEGTLAKHRSTITIEFDNAEYALRAFDAIEYAMSREPVALANEEAGR